MVESLKGSGDDKQSGGDATQSTKKKRSQSEERKLCKGYLYYSSRLRSGGHGPSCVGAEKDIGRVPASIKEKYNVVATREGNLSYFKYACVGNSLYWQDEDSPAKMKDKPASLPICFGYEIVMGKKTTNPSGASKRLNNYKEDVFFIRRRTTDNLLAERGSLGRFTRSAEVVASGVAKNLLRAGSYIKDNLDNMFFPDSRRSK